MATHPFRRASVRYGDTPDPVTPLSQGGASGDSFEIRWKESAYENGAVAKVERFTGVVFWPVRCGSIDLDALGRDRDQLWAEAVARYRAGAIWWLDDPHLIALAKAEQDARYHADAWDDRIERWLVYERQRVNCGYAGYDDWRDEEIERPSPLSDVSVGEILEGALGIEPARWTKGDQMRVGAYLKTRQWERYQARSGKLLEWRYRRLADTERRQETSATN